MAINRTVLCIHRDPVQLDLLQENGYELVTATNGHDGLRLVMSRPVDAIVLEYHLALLDGTIVADEIKRVRPELPIVMLADNLELPDGTLKSVDAIVVRSDGPHFLWATVHFVLSVKQGQHRENKGKNQMRAPRRRAATSSKTIARLQTSASPGPVT